MAEESGGGPVLGVGFRCQRCGAPLEVTPETIVAVCKYCGWPNWTVQAYQYPIVLVPARSREAERFFRSYLERDPDMRGIASRVRLKRLETVYVPVYFGDTWAESSYWGVAEVVVTKVEVRDKEVRTRTRTVVVEVSGTYGNGYTIPVVARRSVDETMIEPLIEYYLRAKPKAVPISEVKWDSIRGDVLAAEITSRDAETAARDEACDRLQEEVKKRMDDEARERASLEAPGWVPSMVTWRTRKIPCKSRVESLSPLTLVPYVMALYEYEGKHYRAVFAGWDGARVYGEEPVLAGQRILYTAGALLSGGLLGGGGAALLAAAGGAERALAGAVLFIAGAALGYFFSKESLKDVRVEEV